MGLTKFSRVALLTLVAALAACSDDPAPARAPLEILVQPELRGFVDDFVEFLPYPNIVVREAADPLAELTATPAAAGALRIAVLDDRPCGGECFVLERASGGFVVHGAKPLGLQYGLAHLLELAGVRFYHPWRTHLPDALAIADDAPDFGVAFEPELALRGLHLHTIHPTEAYWAFWEPSAAHLVDARRILDWVIKNRGNYVQWVALDNIQDDAEVAAAWQAHTAAIVGAAHARGLDVGIGIQLFGASNLQRAWDLIDQPVAVVTARAQIEARLPQMTSLGFDRINISFGEFFSAEPIELIQGVDTAYAVLQEQAPGTEMAATIHVGNKEDQRVTYMDEELQYYFLVKFADAAVVPWVHTVMYYDLFDDAGGAYGHKEFDEHRAFLFARLAAGQRVAYFPESAYWVAFDDSVPTYLPVYVSSRAHDLEQIRAQAPPGLAEHVLFSTGWEWGYWQNDYATLRMNWRLGDGMAGAFAAMWAPYGQAGAGLADALTALAERQHQRLIVERLAPYLAGRDVYLDAGEELGIVAQPGRPAFDALAALPAADRAKFVADVLTPLAAHAEETQAALDEIRALGLPAGDPFVAEIEDGLAIDVARAHAIAACYRAALTLADGGTGTAELAEAEAAVTAARVIVRRRHAALHHPNPAEIAEPNANATIYPFGYLQKADELCYWERELVQVRNLLGVSNEVPPACVL